jgi:hypothetical protein
MAYFPNGTSWDLYYEQYCQFCVHENNEDCPVISAHFLYSYQLCNERSNPGKVILDMLIPEDNGYPIQCSLFHVRDGVVPDPNQMRLEV